MIVKVKEPQPQEWKMLREGQLLFTYLHLAPDPEQARGLVGSGAIAIAYETGTDASGGLRLLAPLVEDAGSMFISRSGDSRGGKAGCRTGILRGWPYILK